ncbi:MAG: CRISPR-associated endoribonuclease Cas2 [candidate division WS2 bacterium]|nr:MAG: CRISPR-associated endonuclease Cas2 [Methanosarcinales archaeon Met12]MBT9130614.1 CRISPR-associated endoribonuclease Cas2 [Candidatus Psychracetigena formicireducens]
MYVIAVYDVNVDRVNKVRIFLKQYLNWVQNSVFEGELTKVELKTIEGSVKDLIDQDEDSVRIYILRSDKFLQTIELGTSKVEISEII